MIIRNQYTSSKRNCTPITYEFYSCCNGFTTLQNFAVEDSENAINDGTKQSKIRTIVTVHLKTSQKGYENNTVELRNRTFRIRVVVLSEIVCNHILSLV